MKACPNRAQASSRRVELVSPLVVKIGSAQVKAGDESLEKNLKAVSDVLESLWEHIDSYVKKGDFSKYVAGNTSRPFAGDLETLRKALDTLSFTLTGETYLAVSRLSDEMKALGAKKTVQERRDSRNLAMEIDDRNIDWYEDKPFARGSFGAVYRVKYERRIVAAKVKDLRDVPAKALEATKKEYKREVALMGELRSQNTVLILGSVTRPTELVILMEYCDGGDLRNVLDKALEGEVHFDKDAQTNMLLDIAFLPQLRCTCATPTSTQTWLMCSISARIMAKMRFMFTTTTKMEKRKFNGRLIKDQIINSFAGILPASILPGYT